jgi:hypothetical protein
MPDISHSPSLRVLYYLKGSGICLVEVKHTDLKNEPDKSNIFFWLLMEKQTGTIKKLDFVSMNSEEGKEQRQFLQGKLSFNFQGGIYEDHQKKYILQNHQPASLQEETEKKIKDFLQSL